MCHKFPTRGVPSNKKENKKSCVCTVIVLQYYFCAIRAASVTSEKQTCFCVRRAQTETKQYLPKVTTKRESSKNVWYYIFIFNASNDTYSTSIYHVSANLNSFIKVLYLNFFKVHTQLR